MAESICVKFNAAPSFRAITHSVYHEGTGQFKHESIKPAKIAPKDAYLALKAARLRLKDGRREKTMAFHKIDLETWPRREYYEHYIHQVVCTYSITVRLASRGWAGIRFIRPCFGCSRRR